MIAGDGEKEERSLAVQLLEAAQTEACVEPTRVGQRAGRAPHSTAPSAHILNAKNYSTVHLHNGH